MLILVQNSYISCKFITYHGVCSANSMARALIVELVMRGDDGLVYRIQKAARGDGVLQTSDWLARLLGTRPTSHKSRSDSVRSWKMGTQCRF